MGKGEETTRFITEGDLSSYDILFGSSPVGSAIFAKANSLVIQLNAQLVD